MTERDKEEVDANAKQMLRELDAGIRILADAEEVRRQTEIIVIEKKYSKRGIGALKTWAAGSDAHVKSTEQEIEEAIINTVSNHRENVLFFLRQRLQKCACQQASMMEKRIARDMESNQRLGQPYLENVTKWNRDGSEKSLYTEKQVPEPLEILEPKLADELSLEQIQMFEKENQDMLRHYESTLNQVRYDM